MKIRLFVLLLVLAVALLGGCDAWYRFADPRYYSLLGTWNVTARPDGWHDSQYIFSEDKELEIYHAATDPSYPGLVYKGKVLSVDEASITTEDLYKADGSGLATMKMCYVLSAEDTAMALGWYTGNDPVYYLEMVKE